MLIESVGLLALESMFGDFVSAITGNTKNAIDKSAIRKAFESCVDVISQFENTGEDSFGEAIKLVFSKENMNSIYKQIKKEKGYDYSSYIRKRLERICSDYEIEADKFIDSFINMFTTCIYEYDKELYDEIFNGEWRDEDRISYNMILTQLSDVKDIVKGIAIVQKQELTVPLRSDEDVSRIHGNLENDEVFLKWEIESPKVKGFYRTNDEKKGAMLQLKKQWESERLEAPSWYIIPKNKRYLLKSYTCNEELLYWTKDVLLEDLFDFAYELVWRYEAAFITYSIKLQTEIRNIWNQMNWETMNLKRQEHWFYIGQVLLREYREDLDIENWKKVYQVLWEKRNSIFNGEAELSLEKVKLLFMQMKIADTRDRLATFQCDSSAVGVRLQLAGLKAECGLLNESMQALQELERDLLLSIQRDSDKRDHVMHKSVLAGTYFLQSFVQQAVEPFQRGEKLESIWDKLHSYEKYFDFEQEKKSIKLELYNNLKKEKKSESFEINRDTKTIMFNNGRFSEVYDFYRLIDRMAMPLHIGYVRLLDDDETDFIKVLLENYQYIGWYMLLRFGSIKTTKKVLSRKECITLNLGKQGLLKKAFDYVYNSVDGNIGSIQEINEYHIGNAYDHVLLNGLEILKRLVTIINMSGQKKIIHLMCKLIDTDIVKEYQVLNTWIRHIMHITEDRVRATMLNELLTCSAKERVHMHGEIIIDPFDTFSTFVQAKHFYQSADIEPDTIDDMLKRANTNIDEKKHFIPRLGLLYEWELLTVEQCEKFANLLWNNVDEETKLPANNDFYYATFLRWPYPKEINVAERIKCKLLDSQNFEEIKKIKLSSITFGDNMYLHQIRELNRYVSDFWEIDEIEIIIRGFLACWDAIKEKMSTEKYSNYYKEEFEDRVKSLLHTLISFKRSQIQKIDISLLQAIKKMADEMTEYDIEAIGLYVMITPDDDLAQVVKNVIKNLRSAKKARVDEAIYTADILLHECYKLPAVQNLLEEILVLCLYRKEPDLKQCLNLIHNLLYSVSDIELPEDILRMLCEALDNIEEYTNYANNIEKAEKEIKNIIRIRIACASLCYQLYRYEQRKAIPYSSAVLNWKDICRGKKSEKEFVEVKRCWLE